MAQIDRETFGLVPSALACKPPFTARMWLSVQRPWRMIRRQLRYVRSTSNTGNQILECPLLGVKPRKFAAVRTWKFGQDRAIWAPDAFGCFPTKADKANLDRVTPFVARSRPTRSQPRLSALVGKQPKASGAGIARSWPNFQGRTAANFVGLTPSTGNSRI